MNDWYVPSEPTIEDRLKAIEARLQTMELRLQQSQKFVTNLCPLHPYSPCYCIHTRTWSSDRTTSKEKE